MRILLLGVGGKSPGVFTRLKACLLVDPVHGLFGASIPSLFYALLGTCPQLSVGPEAGLSLIIGQAAKDIVTNLPSDSSEKHQAAITQAVITLIVCISLIYD